jgi:N,N'-diacetyllegionaminate synthase
MAKTIIIAEAGVNHNGNIEIAKKLIDVAADAGVDYVKFQTFKAENLVTKNTAKAEYQIKNTGNNESQYDMLKRLELSYEDHVELINYCSFKKVNFLSTGFDIESLKMLFDLGIDLIKIPSGEISNVPLLRFIGSKNKDVIVSTGMSTMEEIELSISFLISAGQDKNKITVLHCNTDYPTPFEDVNLRAMLTIKDSLGVKIGYSDHTLGIEVPIAAVTLGAILIEKHFTIDRNLSGPDQKASLEPIELKSMVSSIRNIENALGNAIKMPTLSEFKNLHIARKSIVALCNIKKGELFTEKNLTVKRPGNGISPYKWDDIIGKDAKRDYNLDDLIEW